jgi:hypothetical protein
MNERILTIRKYGKTAKGKKELLKHLSGGKLTFKQAIYGKCFDCMNFFSDGKVDCKMPHCSLYPFYPYRKRRTNDGHAFKINSNALAHSKKRGSSNITLTVRQ